MLVARLCCSFCTIQILSPPKLHFIWFGTEDHFIKKEFIKKRKKELDITEDGFQGESEYNTWPATKGAGRWWWVGCAAKRVSYANVPQGQCVHRVYPCT